MLNGYKTYIGLIIAISPVVAGWFGFVPTGQFESQFAGAVEELVQLVGLSMAFYGRAVAESPGWFVKKKK